MPQIMIPPLGSVIKLQEDWTFRLFDERRNEKLQILADLLPAFRHEHDGKHWRDMTLAERKDIIDKSGWTFENGYPLGKARSDQYSYWSGDWSIPFVLRAETELIIDRYYIRQGSGDFDSVTFRSNCWMSALGDPLFTKKYVNGRKIKSIRFWAKLSDVNKMVGEVLANR